MPLPWNPPDPLASGKTWFECSNCDTVFDNDGTYTEQSPCPHCLQEFTDAGEEPPTLDLKESWDD